MAPSSAFVPAAYTSVPSSEVAKRTQPPSPVAGLPWKPARRRVVVSSEPSAKTLATTRFVTLA